MTSATNSNSNSASTSISPSIPSQRELTVYGFINQLIHKISHSHPHPIVTRSVFPLAIYSVIHLYYGRWGSYEAIAIGRNFCYQMGFALKSPECLSKSTPLPALSSLISDPLDIYLGNGRLLVKDVNNHLHCAGHNEYGDCGVNLGGFEIKSFTRIHSNADDPNETVDDIQFVTSCNSVFHTIVMTSNGDLYSFGANVRGQLCLGYQMEIDDPNNKRIAQRVPQSTTKIFNGQCIVEITTGVDHCLFLTDNGAVYGCGSNGLSQLGLPESQMPLSLIPIRVKSQTTDSESENVAVRITQI